MYPVVAYKKIVFWRDIWDIRHICSAEEHIKSILQKLQ